MVLHHLADPTRALAEMRRVLRPGGTVALTDLLPHRQAWMEEAMGDVRLGLDRLQLARRMMRVGLVEVETVELDDRYLVEDPAGRRIDLAMFLARGRKAAEPE
jgi:ArsR family transcriptional regulator